MPTLTLDYRHCRRMLPLYINHSKVEGISGLARQQLVDSSADAISLSVLRGVNSIKINGIRFDLWVDTDHAVTDEQGNGVLGVCEFDPAASADAAVLSVTPVSDKASAELVLSTFAHELGHAIFEAPGWIFEAAQGAGLFDDPQTTGHKAYRTETRDSEHLAKPLSQPARANKTAGNTELDRSIHFAELRANEFMGSLLVPRQGLLKAVEELADQHGVTINRNPSVDPDFPGIGMHLSVQGILGHIRMESLQKVLATRFGVTPKFIRVRMDRYGLLKPGAKNH